MRVDMSWSEDRVRGQGQYVCVLLSSVSGTTCSMYKKPALLILGSHEPLTTVPSSLHHFVLRPQLRRISGSHKNRLKRVMKGGWWACLLSSFEVCILQTGNPSPDGGQAQLADIW